ncbi:LOW QUALITY PROTEIN: oxidoreductase, partial [Mycobacterium tuberculosis T46]
MTFASPDDVIRRFDEQNYLLDTGTASAIYLAVTLGRPLLLEGEPGVGKTTAAKTLAVVLDTTLIRLQCYEGLTANEALYDWNYQRQLLSIRLAEARGKGISDISEADLYTEAYLVDRPILRCVRHRGPTPPVLLIDEIDRADDEFEALLLEFLGESAVTVPELGTFLAECPPMAVLTSNRSRDLHDALRRRCLYHWIDYPEPDRAAAIVRRTVPGATAPLIENATQFVCTARDLDLDKPPGVAETIDWVAALVALGVADLTAADSSPALASLGALAKTPDDRTQIRDAYQLLLSAATH